MTLQDQCLEVLYFFDKFGASSEWTAGRLRELSYKCSKWSRGDWEELKPHPVETYEELQVLAELALRDRSLANFVALVGKIQEVIPITKDAAIVGHVHEAVAVKGVAA